MPYNVRLPCLPSYEQSGKKDNPFLLPVNYCIINAWLRSTYTVCLSIRYQAKSNAELEKFGLKLDAFLILPTSSTPSAVCRNNLVLLSKATMKVWDNMFGDTNPRLLCLFNPAQDRPLPLYYASPYCLIAVLPRRNHQNNVSNTHKVN